MSLVGCWGEPGRATRWASSAADHGRHAGQLRLSPPCHGRRPLRSRNRSRQGASRGTGSAQPMADHGNAVTDTVPPGSIRPPAPGLWFHTDASSPPNTAVTLGLKLSVTAVFGGDDASVWNQSPGAGGRIEPGGTVSVTAFP